MESIEKENKEDFESKDKSITNKIVIIDVPIKGKNFQMQFEEVTE